MILRMEKRYLFDVRGSDMKTRAWYYEVDTDRHRDRWLDRDGKSLNEWSPTDQLTTLETLRRWLDWNPYWQEVDPIDPDLLVDEGL